MSDELKNTLLGASPVDRLLLIVGFAVVSALLGVDTMEPPPAPTPVVVEAPVPVMDAGGVDGVRDLCEEALRRVRCKCEDADTDAPGGAP